MKQRHDAEVNADTAVAMVAPTEWFSDEHGLGDRPRCCEAVACVALTLRAIDRWTYEDGIAIARVVVTGMDEAQPKDGRGHARE